MLREKLLERMREDRKRMQECEGRGRELRRGVENMRRKLVDMDDEINGNTKISEENKKKYEAIYEREKEIEKYMKDFKLKREDVMVELTQKQEQVLQYLDNMS